MVFVVVDRELRLDDLLPERVLVATQVEVANQLHRDRRAALQRGAVGDVLDGRAEDAGQVDAVVLVEALVLDRDGRVLQVFGDFAPADGAAQVVGLDKAETRAVSGEHLRGAATEDRVQRRERRCRLRDVQDVADRRDHTHEERAREHAAADEEDACGPGAVVPVPTLTCLPGHRLAKRDYRSEV